MIFLKIKEKPLKILSSLSFSFIVSPFCEKISLAFFLVLLSIPVTSVAIC